MDPPIGNGFRLPTTSKLTPSTATTMCNKKCHKRNVGSNNQTVSSTSLSSSAAAESSLLATNSSSRSSISISNTHLKAAKGSYNKRTTPSAAGTIAVGGQGYLRPATTMTRMRHQICSLSFVISLMAVVILNNLGCFITTTTLVSASASAQRENTRILPLQSGELLDFELFCPHPKKTCKYLLLVLVLHPGLQNFKYFASFFSVSCCATRKTC